MPLRPTAPAQDWELAGRTLNVTLEDRDAPYQPYAILVTSGDQIIGHEIAHPDELQRVLTDLLDTPVKPRTLRVSDPRLAGIAAAALGPMVRVQVGPTPDLDRTMDQLELSMLQGPGSELPFPEDLDEDLMASFHEAAARLWAARPWKVIPSDEHVLKVSTPRWPDGCLVVVGQLGESHALIFFASLADWEGFRASAQAMAETGSFQGISATYLSLDFDEAETVPGEHRDLVRRQRWRLPARGWYPMIRAHHDKAGPVEVVDENLFEAALVHEAMARFVGQHRATLSAEAPAPVTERYRINVRGRSGEVTITVPHPAIPWPPEDAD